MAKIYSATNSILLLGNQYDHLYLVYDPDNNPNSGNELVIRGGSETLILLGDIITDAGTELSDSLDTHLDSEGQVIEDPFTDRHFRDISGFFNGLNLWNAWTFMSAHAQKIENEEIDYDVDQNSNSVFASVLNSAGLNHAQTFPVSASNWPGGDNTLSQVSVPTDGHDWGGYRYQLGTASTDILIAASNSEDYVLDGGLGDDTLTGNAGNDDLFGGAGIDTAIYTGNFAGYAISTSGGIITVDDTYAGDGDEGADDLVSVERILFADGVYSEGRFTPTGAGRGPSAQDDLFTVPVNGSVNINVRSNDTHPDGHSFLLDSVTPPAHGSLSVNYSTGVITYDPDTSYTGLDSFTYTIEDTNGKTSTATVTMYVGSSGDLVLGTSGNDSMAATSADEVIHGLAGNDNIAGYGGHDVIFGGDGNDTLRGGAGNDTIYGNSGNDTFADNDGSDQYVGGAGSDRYVFDMSSDTGWAGISDDSTTGYDVVYLDNVAGGDRIEFQYVSGTDQLNVSWYGASSGPADFSFSIRASHALNGRGVESIYLDDKPYTTKSLINAAQNATADTYILDITDADLNGYERLLDDGSSLGAGGGAVTGSDGLGLYSKYNATSSFFLKPYADDFYWGIYYNGHNPAPSGTVEFGGPYQGTRIKGFSMDEVRLTVTNDDNAALLVHFDPVDTTYTYHDFEDGFYVPPGIAVSSSLSGGSGSEWNESGPSRWEYTSDDLSSIVNNGQAFEGATFFMTTMLFGEGIINLLGSLKLEGTAAAETLYGMNRADYLYGYDGNDTIFSKEGNDIIQGGMGTDLLYGGAGDDTFIHNTGDGDDTISEEIGEGTDILELRGRDADDIRAWTDQSGNLHLDDLIDPTDSVIIAGTTTSDGGYYYYQSTVVSRFESIAFDDGIIWDLSNGLTLNGLDDNISTETLWGTYFSDTLYGNGAVDIIHGYSGNDTLIGGEGADTLYGGVGDDIYIHNPGDGEDYIGENADEGTDVLHFKGVDARDVRMWTDQSGHLHLADRNDTSDHIIITAATTSEGGYYYYQSTVGGLFETILFDDTTTWDVTGGLTLEGLDDNVSTETLWGTYYADTLYGHGGVDILNGYSGNDTLVGGEGADTLYGGAGNDIYIHNPGDGEDYISENADEGTDVLHFKGVDAGDVRMWTDQSGHLHLADRNDTSDHIIITAATTSEGGYYYYQSTVGGLFETILFDDTTTWDVTGGLTLEGLDDNVSTETLWGTYYADTLYGHGGVDILNGYSGNDTLVGGEGADTLYGGAGNDIYIHNPGDGEDYISENTDEGTDVLHFKGVDAEDVRMWTDQSGHLHLADRNDTSDHIIITAATTSEGGYYYYQSTVGGLFESILFDDTTTWDVTGGLTLEGLDDNVSTETLWGTYYADTLYGHGGVDILNGYSGNDTLVGDEGADTLYGGAGNDIYIHNPGDGEDYISENADEGTDVLHFKGVDAEDVRMWTDQSGHLHLADRNDTSDHIIITAATTSEGGYYYYQSTVGGLFESILFDDTTSWDLTGGLTLEGLDDNVSTETLWGTYYADTLYGHGSFDILNGYSGNDTLVGGDGADTLYGGAGNDIYIHNPGDGEDYISENADEGTDVLHFKGVDAEDVRMWTDQSGHLHLANRTDTSDHIIITASTTSDGGYYYYQSTVGSVFESVLFDDSTSWDLTGGLTLEGTTSGETLWGTIYNDTLYANDGSDTLHGYSGDDTLIAGSGDDALYGGAEADQLYGEAGSDYLYGDNDNDILYGGANDDYLYGGDANDRLHGNIGSDTLTGDAGADTFVFNAADVGNGSDTIVDFSLVDDDVLDIADILSAVYDPLTDAITDFVQITDNGTHSFLAVDVDGGANSFVQIAQINNVIGLTDEEALETGGYLIAA